jgi:hypothetical protein
VGQVLADIVAKVTAERSESTNAQQTKPTNGFLDQHCALASDLESMLLAGTPKMLLQQYLPKADFPSYLGFEVDDAHAIAEQSDRLK